jgi:GT2 family glycosyltransferase
MTHHISPLRVGVIIATKGRPQALPHVLQRLESQTVQPDVVVVSAHEQMDVGLLDSPCLNLQCLFGPAGLPRQRNLAIDQIIDNTDIIVFFDDDFAPSRFWIERCIEVFHSNTHVVGLSGTVLKDGVSSREAINWDEAQHLLDTAAADAPPEMSLSSRFGLYGCNMAFRTTAIGPLRFDERLVLYGWLEDKDFSVRIGTQGRLVESNTIHGVHLGLRSGRVSGKRFGYSQVVNAWHLRRKGVLSAKDALHNILRAVITNLVKSLAPESHIDRRGRFRGNMVGVLELLSGRCRPERAADL